VDALPYPKDLKMSPDRLRKVSEVHGEIVRAGNGLVPQQTTDKLELRIHKVHCIDETNGQFVEKVGNDEIHLGGTAVDQSGKTHKIAPFLVGANFDDGESKTFKPPRRFTTFDLREGTDFPKSYFVTFVLFEKDGGGAAEFINKLLAKVKERVIAAITAAVGGFVGASGGPVGVAIGAAIGFVVGKVFEALKAAIDDDPFPPKTVSLAITAPDHRFKGKKTDSPEFIVRFKGNEGLYEVKYDWRVFA
jgi:hypothetical protein